MCIYIYNINLQHLSLGGNTKQVKYCCNTVTLVNLNFNTKIFLFYCKCSVHCFQKTVLSLITNNWNCVNLLHKLEYTGESTMVVIVWTSSRFAILITHITNMSISHIIQWRKIYDDICMNVKTMGTRDQMYLSVILT